MTGAEHFHAGETALADADAAQAGSTAQANLYLKAAAHFTAAQAAIDLGVSHIDQTTEHDRKALELGRPQVAHRGRGPGPRQPEP